MEYFNIITFDHIFSSFNICILFQIIISQNEIYMKNLLLFLTKNVFCNNSGLQCSEKYRIRIIICGNTTEYNRNSDKIHVLSHLLYIITVKLI